MIVLHTYKVKRTSNSNQLIRSPINKHVSIVPLDHVLKPVFFLMRQKKRKMTNHFVIIQNIIENKKECVIV